MFSHYVVRKNLLRIVRLIATVCFLLIPVSSDDDLNENDDLYPPFASVVGRGHRHVRECQPAKYNNVTNETVPSHNSTVDDRKSHLPFEVRYFSTDVGLFYSPNVIHGHHVIVDDPAQTVSVLEPQGTGGCATKIRETVEETARRKNCLFAVNAGYFNVTDGSCLGNVVSDGFVAFDSGGIQNAHFGIKKDGSLFFGYIGEDEALNETFKQLVGGAVWLVRDGQNYVETSKVAECPDVQSTGSMQQYIDIQSGRVAIGNDILGRVVIVQVDGKTTSNRGINLNDFANFLISLGVVNAINLDGGGSATAVLNGTVINYPSDIIKIDNIDYNVARNVTTIICVSDYECLPNGCGYHGDCVHGDCRCHVNWHGASCSVLKCGGTANCSDNGVCTSDGCKCHSGWHGDDCSLPCPTGRHGYGCQGVCMCTGNVTTCDVVSGRCKCPAGYSGYFCESVCPLGSFGEDCKGVCRCDDGCFCHPVDGSCEFNSVDAAPQGPQGGQCYGDLKVVSRSLEVVSSQELEYWLWAVVFLSVVALLSVIVNFFLVWKCCTSSSFRSPFRIFRRRQRQQQQRRDVPFVLADDDDEEEEEEEEETIENMPLMKLDGKM